MSRGTWVKPAESCYAPSRLISVIVRGRAASGTSHGGRTPIAWELATVAASTRTAGGWRAPTLARFDTPAELHDWLENRAVARSGTWVVSPCASASLTLSRFWDRVDTFGGKWSPRAKRPITQPQSPGLPLSERHTDFDPTGKVRPSPDSAPAAYIFSSLVLRGKVDIVKYKVAGKTLTWVSCSQYLPIQEPALADSLGFLWPRSGGPPPVGSFQLMDPTDRAELWLLAFQRLADWWVERDGGPWRPTIGGLSDSFFRHRLAPKTVLAHQDDYARSLEEVALFGGRASTWFYGSVGRPGEMAVDDSVGPDLAGYDSLPGPAELWDVSSMYPTILANERFPTKHMYNWKKPSFAQVLEMCDTGCAIASVRVKSESGEYPVRDGDRVTFPVGEFDTALCGPELMRALQDCEIVSVYHASSYAGGRPFSSAAQELIDIRRALPEPLDAVQSAFVKLLSNNFGGRMAMRKHGMVEVVIDDPEVRWGAWGSGNLDRGTRKRYLSIAGLTWELVEPRHKGRPLASCYCYLTAYGRSLMRSIRELLPPRSVVSQDTDGLWVVGATDAMRTAAVSLAAQRGCRLRIDRSTTSGRWFGPKHYWTTSGWVLAGIREQRTWLGSLKWADGYTINPVLGKPKSPPRMVWEVVRESDLLVVDRDGMTGADGWTIPTRIGPAAPR